jgi:hypothetical protein
MRSFFLTAITCLWANCFYGTIQAQILAITKDGQRVVLFGNGTWKFESELDSSQHLTTTPTAAAPETPATIVIPKPPRVYSLECSALVDVEKDINSDAYVAVSKGLVILKEDSTVAFSLSMTKSKKSSLMWITTIPGKPCITAENKILIVLKDGLRYTLVTDSKPNCDGVFKLFFGNLDGKDIPLQSLKQTEISSVRIFTEKGYVEANFDEENARKFKAAMNCIAKNL